MGRNRKPDADAEYFVYHQSVDAFRISVFRLSFERLFSDIAVDILVSVRVFFQWNMHEI